MSNYPPAGEIGVFDIGPARGVFIFRHHAGSELSPLFGADVESGPDSFLTRRRGWAIEPAFLPPPRLT
jgi:hypothetical protein